MSLPVGAKISVELTAVEKFKWSMPETSDPNVVSRATGAVGRNGSASAAFTVVGSGQAQLSAIDNPECYPICALPPARGWRVIIVAR